MEVLHVEHVIEQLHRRRIESYLERVPQPELRRSVGERAEEIHAVRVCSATL